MRTNLRTVLLAIAFGAMVFGAQRARAGTTNPVQVLTGFSAKESCSCAFVVEQSDAYCTAFGQVGPAPVGVAIDHDAKTVTSSFAGFSRTARFTEGAGCLTDPLP